MFRPASQSFQHSDGMEASKAVDGNTATLSHTEGNDFRPWWKAHLAYPIWVKHVEIVKTGVYGKQNYEMPN